MPRLRSRRIPSAQNEKVKKAVIEVESSSGINTHDTDSESCNDSEVDTLVENACEGMDLDTSSDSDNEDEDEHANNEDDDNDNSCPDKQPMDSSNLFVIDKSSNSNTNVMIPSYDLSGPQNMNTCNNNGSDSDSDFDIPESSTADETEEERYDLSSELQHSVDTSNLYVDLEAYKKPKSSVRLKQRLLLPKNDEIMKKSVITPDFEKKNTVPPYQEGVRQARKRKKKEKELSKGKNWYHMPATEMTEDKKNDLTVLQMRKILDPKRFYKNPDLKVVPKYFQMAKIIESPADFYSGRIPKKQRKATIVDELLADAEFKKYNKRKYMEIQHTQPQYKSAYKHMKKLKKRKKGK